MYSLYYHKNKTNNKLYFGITCKKPEIRWANGTGYKKQPFYRAIKKYGWDNFEHIIIKDNLPEACAKTLEKILIYKYNTRNPKYGYNATDGGDGTCGIIFTQERKDKIRNKCIGKFVSKATKKKMSDSHKEVDLSYLDNSFGKNGKAKRVGAFKDDKLIKEYDCAVRAALDVGVHKNSISKAIREGYKVKEFDWKYL